MKRLTDYLKSNILIILGALLFIYYLNFLSYSGAALGIGISAIVLSAYYLFVGILFVLTGSKLKPKTQLIFNLLSVTLFAVFMFVGFLLTPINAARVMGPTAWTINILSMAASLALVVIYIVSKFSAEPFVSRFAHLVSLIFVLTLLLDILFEVNGTSKSLGDIDVLLVVIYGFYSCYLFGSLNKTEELSTKKKATTEEKTQDETATTNAPQSEETEQEVKQEAEAVEETN